MRRLAGTAALVGSVLLGLSPAAAQVYPPLGVSVAVDPSAISCGTSVTIRGAGWLPGSTVEIVLSPDPVVLGTTGVFADGTFEDTFRTPTTLDVASHTLTVNGQASDGSAATSLTTLTVVSCGGASALAFTGSDSSWLVQLGAVLLVVGAVLVVAMARRRRARQLVA